jgi:ArsR family transcriptional regulator
MCNKENMCEKPESLKTKSQECTPEQIKKCHGDVKEHPCVQKGEHE